jgi:hypothetical protein
MGGLGRCSVNFSSILNALSLFLRCSSMCFLHNFERSRDGPQGCSYRIRVEWSLPPFCQDFMAKIICDSKKIYTISEKHVNEVWRGCSREPEKGRQRSKPGLDGSLDQMLSENPLLGPFFPEYTLEIGIWDAELYCQLSWLENLSIKSPVRCRRNSVS